MAINDSLIYAIPEELIGKVATLMIVLQALGAAIILYLIFSIINLFINKKKNKELQLINKNLEDIKQILISKQAK